MTTWGIPWADPQHLTLSFAPDGTQVAGQQSQLFQTFDSEVGAGIWEKELLQGVQTWASNANINVGVVPDGGEPLGSVGPAQGDPRFGDIRITAAPLAAGVLATSSPYDPSLGTFSGDLILNTSYDWNPADSGSYDLLTVALHEAGHLFGFADSSDPSAFMYNVYTGPKTGISSNAVTALQALYGPATAASPEPANNTISTATPLPPPPDDATNTTLADNLDTPGEVNFYSFQVPKSLSGSGADFSVQTAGISLLTPTLTVLDASGNILGTSSASGPLSGGTLVHLNSISSGARYYVKVSGAAGDAFSMGSYNLAINANSAGTAGTSAMSTAKPTPLAAPPGTVPGSPLAAGGSVVGQGTQHVYSFKTSSANTNGVTVQLQQWGVGLNAPQLQVYDSNQNLVASTASADPSNQTLTLYLSAVNPKSTYFVQVKNGLTYGLGAGVFQVQVAFNSTAQGSSAVNMTTTSFAGTSYGKGLPANSTLGQATPLQTPVGYAANTRYATLDTLTTTSPQAYFKINTPPSVPNQSQFMTVTVESLPGSSLNPWVKIFDNKGNAVNAICLSNQGGVGVFQIPVSSTVASYSVEVLAAQAGVQQSTGDFYLSAEFQNVGATPTSLASGTYPALTLTGSTSSAQTVNFTSDQSRYYQFTFGSNAGGLASGVAYQATILDQNGNPLGTSTILANQSSSLTVFLLPGTYTIQLTSVNQVSSWISPLSWNINEESLSDPILPYTYKGSGSSSCTYPQ